MTIKEKIEELDKKFEGLKEAFEQSTKLQAGNKLTRYMGFIKNGRVVIRNCTIFSDAQIDFINNNNREVSFKATILKECINKAHDYFIVKGGEL